MERKDVRYVLFINRTNELARNQCDFVSYSLVDNHSGSILLKTYDRYKVKIVLDVMGLKFSSYETSVRHLLDDTKIVFCYILLEEIL